MTIKAALLVSPLLAIAQGSFSPEAYMQFREVHLNITAGELIADHPPSTTYYDSRREPADLVAVPWYDTLNRHFNFTAGENEFLKQNLFMVSERLSHHDWASAFISLYSRDLPLFLSTDFILSTLHSSYDAILQTIEWQFLEPNLKELLKAMYNEVPGLALKYSADDRYSEVLNDVDLYIAVARSLAEGERFAPQIGNGIKYDEVMAAVASGKMTQMTLFTENRTRKLDFSQFTPRGHYNKTVYTSNGPITLENYFRAMMWLGRIDFLLTAPPGNPWEPDWTVEELRRMQLGALLLNEVLYGCGKLEYLKKHEEIISFMVGPDDNMTPGELKALSDQLLSSAGDLFTADNFDVFTEALNASDNFGQKIMSNFFYVDPFSSDPGQLPVSFKLLGQKFLIDSYVFSEVVYDRILNHGKKIYRPLPDPLDVMAALGNEDALALLESEMDSFKYASNMAGLKYLIGAYDEEFWTQSLYNTWLDAIRNLNPGSSASGLPYFMQTTAWHHEKLNTQLTSWAQLRHDNILYGKQSYTGGTGCSYPYTYVEPYPAFYGSLVLFADQAADFFGNILTGEVDGRDRIVEYYRGYAMIMEKLEGIAISEIQGTPLSGEEVTFLKTMINAYMASGPFIDGWYSDLFFDIQKGLTWDFTVADVHTQPTDESGAVVGRILHVGNGVINMGVFLAENPCNPGQYMAFAGPVSSFHTKVTSGFERLDDRQWEEYFWFGTQAYPGRPDWVASYLLDRKGNRYPEGRALKGVQYTGTGIPEANRLNLFDYLILFPNPASGQAGLRFVLNRQSDLTVEVYDASGRLIHSHFTPDLAPAEHNITIPVSQFPQGLYLVRSRIGNQVAVKELVVQ